MLKAHFKVSVIKERIDRSKTFVSQAGVPPITDQAKIFQLRKEDLLKAQYKRVMHEFFGFKGPVLPELWAASSKALSYDILMCVGKDFLEEDHVALIKMIGACSDDQDNVHALRLIG